MRIKDTAKEYYVIVNCEDLLRAAERNGFDNAILCGDDGLSEEELQFIKDRGKSVLFIVYYDDDGKYPELHEVGDQLREMDIQMAWCHDLIDCDTSKQAASEFLDIQRADRFMIEHGYMLDADYTNRCGNCHAYLGEKDKFCRRCGTRRGEGRFLPYENIIGCAYGPPTEMQYTCKICGHTWRYRIQVYDEKSQYCPACGSARIHMDDEHYLTIEEWLGPIPDEKANDDNTVK